MNDWIVDGTEPRQGHGRVCLFEQLSQTPVVWSPLFYLCLAKNGQSPIALVLAGLAPSIPPSEALPKIKL